MDTEKILVWYLDTNGDTRVQVIEKPSGYLMQTFLYEFSRNEGVQTILEAYTISVVHTIVENTWTEGFTVESTNVGEEDK